LQLLLVDPDPRAQRLVAAGLSRNGFTVTAVSTEDEALARLRAHPVDGVLCAASLPGEGALAVREAVRGGGEGAPFMLLVDGAGAGPLSRWEPLAPVDVVARPVALGDLVARVRAALDAAVRKRLEAGAEQSFHSSVDRMSLLDVVEFFRAQGRSGTVTFSGARDGRLVFHVGAPVDAVAGVQSGKEAFFRLLSAREGTYDLQVGETSPEGNMGAGAEALVDEGIAYLEAWDRALEQVPPLASVLEQDAVRVAEVQGALPEEAGWVLRLVDGERSVEDLVEASTLGGLAVLEILARLYFEGLISVRKGMAVPSRRPRVDEWLNSPPNLPRDPAPAPAVTAAEAVTPPFSRTTQALSREELDAFAGFTPQAGQEPVVDVVPGLSRDEADAFAAISAPVAPEPVVDEVPGLSRDEADAVAAISAPVAPEPVVNAAPGLSREALPGLAQDPAASARTTQSLSREELDAFAGMTPEVGRPEAHAGVVEPAVSEVPGEPAAGAAPLPGFVDEGGFPMGSSSVVADPTPFGLSQAASAAPVDQGAEGAFPFHFARASAGAGVPPRPAAGAHETGRGEVFQAAAPPPPGLPVPETAHGTSAPADPAPAPPVDTVPPEAPRNSPPAPAPAPPDDDADFVPVKRNWGFAAVAVGGVLLMGIAAYFGTRTSANTPEPAAPVAVAPPAAPVDVPAQPTEVDAGQVAEAAADVVDAGTPVAESSGAVAADAHPAPAPAAVAAPPAAAPAPAQPPVAAAVPAVSPAAAPAQVQHPVAVNPPAPAAVTPPPVVAQAPAAVQVPTPAPKPAPQKAPAAEFDLARVTTPPPQTATAQDRVAPGVLPRKTARPVAPVPTQPAAATPEAGANTEAASVLKGARRAQVVGNWKSAVDGYRKALALGADTPEVKAGLGISLVSTDPGIRGYQEATELLKQSLAQDGGNANAWLSLGMAYQFTGNNAEAVKAYKRYLALAPTGKSAAEVRAMLERL